MDNSDVSCKQLLFQGVNSMKDLYMQIIQKQQELIGLMIKAGISENQSDTFGNVLEKSVKDFTETKTDSDVSFDFTQ